VSKIDVKRKAKQRTAAPKSPGRQRSIVRVLLLFIAAVIVVDALVGDRGLLAMLRARKEYDELAATISREQAENVRLREEARRLRDDPAAIEELARRDLGLIKPGEKVFIVKDVEPATKPASPSGSARPPAPPSGR
jgi:cell division protein FtsB